MVRRKSIKRTVRRKVSKAKKSISRAVRTVKSRVQKSRAKPTVSIRTKPSSKLSGRVIRDTRRKKAAPVIKKGTRVFVDKVPARTTILRRRTRTKTRTVFRPAPTPAVQPTELIQQPGQLDAPQQPKGRSFRRFRRGAGKTINVQKDVKTRGERFQARAGRRISPSGQFRGRATDGF